MTVPLRLDAAALSSLTLNADATGGQIRAQLRDATGQIAPGFSFGDCDPITADGIALPVRWKSAAGRPANVKQPFQLELEISHASVFAFSVGG